MIRIKPEVAAALIAGALHELRNHLAVASSALYLARQASGTQEKNVTRAERHVRAAQDLVTRLFDVARGGKLEADQVGARHVLDQALAGVTVPDGVAVAVAIRPEALELSVDPILFPVVISNLVQNAVDSVRAGGGRVAVTLAATEVGADISVEDDGPGLDPATAFASSGVSSKEGGAGLGLLLVRTLVEAHGGTVRCERPARGARFVIELPREPGA